MVRSLPANAGGACGGLASSWTVACKASLSMEFSRQEYWSVLPFPSPGDLPDPGIEPASPVAPALQADSLPLSHWGSPYISLYMYKIYIYICKTIKKMNYFKFICNILLFYLMTDHKINKTRKLVSNQCSSENAINQLFIFISYTNFQKLI